MKTRPTHSSSGPHYELNRRRAVPLVITLPALILFSLCIVLAMITIGWSREARSATVRTSSDDNWPSYNHDYASTRYSTLSQITKANVAHLRPVCAYPLPEPTVFESGPVVIDGTLYLTTFETTYAIDAATCTLRWRAQHPLPQTPRLGANRGVAYADGKLFRGTVDGYGIAYEAQNGKQLWATKVISPDSHEYLAAAPIAWNGMVFLGTAGADAGEICRVLALEAATGRILWNFPLVPSAAGPGAESWPKEARRSGGSTWSSFTLDEAAGALYVPAGNPGPDFAGEARPGANAYTGSVVVLDARSGHLKTWYQLVPHDVHDYDVAATPALITTPKGQRRALTAGKDGHLHAIDVVAGRVVWQTPTTTIENTQAPITVAGTRFCPGTTGGTEWNGPAYSPQTNLAYVNTVDWCTTIKLDPSRPAFVSGKNFLGSTNGFGTLDPIDKKRGWVTAVNADTGAVQWRYHAATPMLGGITATAGGLVLSGDLNGDLLAFDAVTGEVLWRHATQEPVGGGVVTYAVGGRQLVAVAAGFQSPVFETHARVTRFNAQGRPVLLVYGL